MTKSFSSEYMPISSLTEFLSPSKRGLGAGMVNNNGDPTYGVLDANLIATKYTTTNRTRLYDHFNGSSYADTQDGSINDLTGMDMLEVMEKGVYKTLVARRDDAKAVWEEEDDDASYGEYKALKDAVELLAAFILNAPKARYSGLKRRPDRYDGYGQRY